MFFWTIFLVLCAFCAANVDANNCEHVKAPMCANMPYNLTTMPNIFNHATQENALLAIEQYQPLVNTGCSKVLSFFLCTMYFPVCAAIESPLKPCKSLCEEAKMGCLPIMMRYNVSWPEHLACEQLPEYSQGLCVMPDTIIQDPSSTPPKDVIIPQIKPETEDSERRRRPGGRPSRPDRKNRRKQKKAKKSKEERRQEKADRKRERQQKKLAKKEERRQKRQRRRGDRRGSTDVVAEDLVQDNQAATTRAPDTASKPCVCQPPRQIKKELKTNQYTYKIQASWLGLERSPDGSSLMKFKLLETYSWPNEGYLEKGDTVTLVTNKTCICPRFKQDRAYLVAGYGAGSNLTYDAALKWKPILKKLLAEKASNGKPSGKRRQNVRKERKRKQKQGRRNNKPDRKPKKDDRRKPRRKNRGRKDDKKQNKKEQKKRRKEERKERRKERRRKKWGATDVPLLEWTTTEVTPTDPSIA